MDPKSHDYHGVLSKITDSYTDVFSGYVDKLTHYGKEIFVVLLVINITWIALWYAFDKDSLAAGMSGFLKKFTVAIIFYCVMINPQYMSSLIDTSTQMGLGITGQKNLDPSSIIDIGMNVGLAALASIKGLSFIFNASGIIVALGVFFIVIFCFMSVALQVAVTLVIATALAMFSCFTLGFSGLDATAGMARKSIDALIGACFKLLGYYVVIGASLPVFESWKTLPKDFFHDTRQAAFLCSAALMFWLLSKSLPAVFERVGGGLIGETAGVDFAAIAVSTAKTAAMAMMKKRPSETAVNVFNGGGGGGPSGGSPGGGAKGFQESGWGKSKTAANDPNTKGPNNTGGGQMQVKAPGGASANDAVGKGATQNSASSNSNNKSTPQNNAANDANKNTAKSSTAANDSHAGKGGGSTKGASAAGSGRARTYPGMSKDKPKQAIGA